MSRLLIEAFPTLANLPWTSLANLPTPLSQLSHLSQETGSLIWCKQDDQTGTLYGGNKVRKLEYLFGEALARGAKSIVTIGALGSHHALATACYGMQLGLDVHAILGPQPLSPHAETNLKRHATFATKLHLVSTYASVPWRLGLLLTQLKLAKQAPYFIAPGGSSPVGVLGYVEAGLELAAQLRTQQLLPNRVYAALGTGGTVAGLCIGLALADMPLKVRAVRVTPVAISSERALYGLIDKTVKLLRKHDPTIPNVTQLACGLVSIHTAALGDGYAFATPEATAAVEKLLKLEQLTLETTYTGKAMAALLAEASSEPGQTHVYLHSLSGT